MDDKFILMNLDDEGSKKIAEVLGNKTCKKILDFLAETKEASEQDISKSLNIPINTVEYNLNKLIDAKLVEKTKNFFWSVKGKKIDLYKLAKKHIIISPKSSKPNMNLLRAILPVVVVIALVAIIIGFVTIPSPILGGNYTSNLKQFNSYDELNQFLKENSESQSSGGFDMFINKFGGPMLATSVNAETASDYSQTNIQVEGVDEADIVKNDGKYIYTISGNKVIITEAYPAENMKIVSEIDLNKSVSAILINENKLIVFSNSYEFVPYYSTMRCLRARCGGYSDSNVLVSIYNIEDKENAILEKEIETSGNYVDSRMINNYVYVISTKYVNLNMPELPVYKVDGIEQNSEINDLYYFDYPDSNYVFSSIMAINVNNNEFNSKLYLTGASNNLYVSQDNIYLTYTKYLQYDEEYIKNIVEDVYLPILSDKYDEQVQRIVDSDKESYKKLNEINQLIYDYSQSLKGDEKADFDMELLEKTQEFNLEMQKRLEKTAVHKININKLDIDYISSGEVPGHVLNQFSMDEFNENFRIVTTTGNSWQGNSLNHLYVLNSDLEIIGKVEDLAKGETVYSARFLGNRAYVVTFKKVDPLFVIDLSDPEEPEVLGYLKITGFSDYLHIYDEDHIIGIGKETRGGSDQFSWYQGLKISIFDVSDVSNPIETAKLEIGDRGTSSEALNDHKAVLFDKEKGILVLPVQLYEINESSPVYGDLDSRYGQFVWQGAYVLNINQDEISIRGKITHNNDTFEGYGDYYSSIRRSLFMDDFLYTISSVKIKANNLNTLEEISSVNLPENNYYPIYY